MFVSRDQENLVHAHQTAAAGKPLNQNVRALQPKTPGNKAPKTPFRVALNDENKPVGLNGQKTTLRGLGVENENGLQGGKKDGKLEKNAFVTPIGPRTRAPLGAKTTNAKAHAFQTLDPRQQTVKPEKTNKRPSTARKSIKSKITIAPSEPVKTDILGIDEYDVPDIEYAPPPPKELPDPPEDFMYDQTFPQFQGANMCRGWGEIYLDEPKDEHGVPLRVREYESKCAEYDKEVERQIEESLKSMPDPDAELDKQVDAMIAAGPRKGSAKDSKVSTIRARGAVDALSCSQVPTTATKSTTSSLQKTKKKPTFSVLSASTKPEPTNPSPMRHTAAEAISRNTIGFPRARHAPSILPPKQKHVTTKTPVVPSSVPKQSELHPVRFRELYGEPPEGSDMWLRLREHELLEAELGEDDGLLENIFQGGVSAVEDDEDVFQL